MSIKTLIQNFILKKKHDTFCFRIMTTAFIMLLMTGLPVSANFAYSEHSIIELNTYTISVGELISNIEKQTEFLVLFRSKDVDTDRTLNLKTKSGEIATFLKSAFANS